MFHAYHASNIGFRHIEAKKPCQDSSLSDASSHYAIIVTADGHGSDLYFRSQRGAELAIQVAYEIFIEIIFAGLKEEFVTFNFHQLKLAILTRWNQLVENDLQRFPFNEEELSSLTKKQKQIVENDFFQAYGTTLNASLWMNDFLLSIQIGDGTIVSIDMDSKPELLFQNIEDDTAGSITHSLCESDAYQHIEVHFLPKPQILALIHATDGLVTPFVSLENYLKEIKTTYLFFIQNNSDEKIKPWIASQVKRMAERIGLGDDVSMAIAVKKPLKRED